MLRVGVRRAERGNIDERLARHQGNKLFFWIEDRIDLLIERLVKVAVRVEGRNKGLTWRSAKSSFQLNGETHKTFEMREGSEKLCYSKRPKDVGLSKLGRSLLQVYVG